MSSVIRAAGELELLAPWRKYYICKPLEKMPTKEEAVKFLADFISALDDIDAGTTGNWTLADVATGVHEGELRERDHAALLPAAY